MIENIPLVVCGWGSKAEVDYKGSPGTFAGDGNFLYLDCGDEQTYICQNSSNCTLNVNVF